MNTTYNRHNTQKTDSYTFRGWELQQELEGDILMITSGNNA